MDNLRADLNSVRVFAQVVESKNFRAAARALGMPRSTVSFRVAQLEDQLGERLLERTTRSLRLTDAGAAYHRRALGALEALQEAERTLSDQKSQISGKLRVTATVEGGQFLLAPLFAEYARRYPLVELDVFLADRQVDLIEEGVDLAIRAGALPDSSFVARRLGVPHGLRVYASPGYLKAHGTPRRPRDLANRDCLIMTAQSQPRRWPFTVARKPVSITVKARAQANSFVVIRELACRGLGIARLPLPIAQPAVDAGNLLPLLDAFAQPAKGGGLHAVYPSARHLSAKVRALLDLLEELFPCR
ncbi:MAG TPA: LysR substrate-binding domain-containing protein [Polyangiaceae bacterium]|nr:LysR substrate-binding domain-containing protein [Polyangiaceae bacterium]